IGCPKATAINIDNQYLHANRIGSGISKRIFIASQAPHHITFPLFWQTAFNIGNIVDLTRQEEENQFEDDTKIYYPEIINQSQQHGPMQVTLLNSEVINDFQIFHYLLTNTLTKSSKNISRLHYSHWKDLSAIPITTLQQLVDTLESTPKDEGICVHCMAGVGRTGTLITACILKEQILTKKIDKTNLDDSLIELIIALRVQRGKYFVEKESQLALLRNYALLLLNNDF
ncbi:MAG: dual specificity protein phosphatase family protein, partial [Parachlamydiaceae bacterium]|nr:dual specificity protein phosphatase family protein [Parachlamydiaceae bacterium]